MPFRLIHLITVMMLSAIVATQSRSAIADDEGFAVGVGFYLAGFFYEPLIPPAYNREDSYKFVPGLGFELDVRVNKRWSLAFRGEFDTTQIREFAAESRLSYFNLLSAGAMIYWAPIRASYFTLDVGAGGGAGIAFTSYSIFGVTSPTTDDSALVPWGAVSMKGTLRMTESIFGFLAIEGRWMPYRENLILRELNAAILPVWIVLGAKRHF